MWKKCNFFFLVLCKQNCLFLFHAPILPGGINIIWEIRSFIALPPFIPRIISLCWELTELWGSGALLIPKSLWSWSSQLHVHLASARVNACCFLATPELRKTRKSSLRPSALAHPSESFAQFTFFERVEFRDLVYVLGLVQIQEPRIPTHLDSSKFYWFLKNKQTNKLYWFLYITTTPPHGWA